MAKNWAICIGINGYHNLKPLKYARRDAAAMRDFYLYANFEQVYFFAEEADPIRQDHGPLLRSEPTIGTLERFLRVRFEQRFLEAGDNLWFFFAGHGKRFQGRDYLMPLDGDPGNVERTGLALRDITDRLRRCGADNIILMLDACRGEDDRDSGEGIGVEQQQGVITLFSCSPNELSYEIDELQQGAFTYALLQGLRIQGEGNCATVERLYQYLRYQVPALNTHYKKQRQMPYAIVEPATKLHLILLPKQATLQDVMALKNDALEAEAEADWEVAEQLWIRVLVVYPGDLQAVKALQRIALRRHQQSPGQTVPPPVTPEATAGTTGSRSPETPEVRSVSQSPPTVPVNYRVEAIGTSSVPPIPTPKPVFTFDFDVVTITKIEKGGLFGAGAPRVITQSRKAKAEYRREELGRGVTLDLVLIPGGEGSMGSNEYTSEQPIHQVKISPFLMGKYPVTQAQWKAVAALPKVARDLEADPANFKGDQRPIECIDWDSAVEFCLRLSTQTGRQYRLPSEAEWEYACRAGTTTPFYFGETITTDLANYNGNYTYASGLKGQYREQTSDVGSFPANAFGLYDMHGNVYEWCLDHWHDNYEGAPTDGSAWIGGGDSSRRLLRGGSWDNDPANCRSAYRFRYARVDRNYVVGFRVVCVSSWAL